MKRWKKDLKYGNPNTEGFHYKFSGKPHIYSGKLKTKAPDINTTSDKDKLQGLQNKEPLVISG